MIDLGSFEIGGDLRAGGTRTLQNEQKNTNAQSDLENQTAGGFFSSSAEFESGEGEFKLDILDDPTNIFKLFIGDSTATFFTFKLPDLEFEFDAEYRFNTVVVFVPVFFAITGGGKINGQLSGGMDARGLFQYQTSNDTEDLLNGFFLNSGAPVLTMTGSGFNPEEFLKVSGGIGATYGVEFDINDYTDYLADLGFAFDVEIEATGALIAATGLLKGAETDSGNHGIEFTLRDSTPPRYHLDEILADAEGGLQCLFDVSGGVDWEAKIETDLSVNYQVEVDFCIEEVAGVCIGFEAGLEGRTEAVQETYVNTGGSLFDLDLICDIDEGHHGGHEDPDVIANPQLATLISGGILRLNIGEFGDGVDANNDPVADERRIDQDEINEVYRIEHVSGSPSDAGGETVIIYAFDTQETFTGVKLIYGEAGDGDDTILIDAAVLSPALLGGGDDNDTLAAGSGGSLMSGGLGNDILTGGSATDTLFGDEGMDVLRGGDSQDFLFGGTEDDDLYGEDGEDELTGGLGNDDIFGGSGTDTLIESGDVDFTLTNTSLDGLGSDTLESIEIANLTGGASRNTFTVGDNSAQNTLSAWTGIANLDAGDEEDHYIVNFNTARKGEVNINETAGTTNTALVNGTFREDTFDLEVGKVSNGNQKVNYTGITQLTVDGQLKADTFNVISTETAAVSLKGDSGADVFNAGLGDLSQLKALVSTFGGFGIDTLNADDTDDTTGDTGQLTAGSLTGLDMGPDGIQFDLRTELINILLGSGDDQFRVRGVLEVLTVDTDGNRVGHTSIAGNAGNDIVTVNSAAADHTGDLDGIRTTLSIDAGTGDANRLIVSDFGGGENPNVIVTNNKITGFAPVAINYQATDGHFTNGDSNDGILLKGSNTARDVFHVQSTLEGSTTQIESNGGNDYTTVGSDEVQDNGNLDTIKGLLTLLGGDGDDDIYVNDYAKEGLTAYRLLPDRLVKIDDPADERGARADLPERPDFAGIFFDGTAERLKLVGNDEVNLFAVRPSKDTEFSVDGRDPEPHDCEPGGGDFLKLSLAPYPPTDPNPVTGQQIHFTRVVDGHQEAGFWSFDEPHKNVNFEHIERFNFVDKLVVGSDAGKRPNGFVQVFDAASGRFEREINVFPVAISNGKTRTYLGGVRVASADMNCDGIPDIIVAAGPGHLPEVKVFNGIDGTQIGETILVGKLTDTFGVNLTVGDTNFDGHMEIITSLERVRGAKLISVHQLEHDGFVLIDQFDSGFNRQSMVGVNVTAGDLNGDGRAEIVVTNGPGVAPQVAIFDRHNNTVARFNSFPKTMNGGIHASIGDVGGSALPELILTAGRRGNSQLQILNGQDAVNGTVTHFQAPRRIFNDKSSTVAALRSTLKDIDGDLDMEIYVAQGTDGRNKLVRLFHMAPDLTVFKNVQFLDQRFGGYNIG